jgi:hypothetical protein
VKIFVAFHRVLRLYLRAPSWLWVWFPLLPEPALERSEGFLRVSKVLVYQRSSAQISGKKLVFLLVAALPRCVEKQESAWGTDWRSETLISPKKISPKNLRLIAASLAQVHIIA